MPYLCLECLEEYREDKLIIDKELEKNYKLYCPKALCKGHIVQIDELILPTVSELNHKGYRTAYCCSGHISDRLTDNDGRDFIDSYIAFGRLFEFKSLPTGWTSKPAKLEHPRPTIKRCFDSTIIRKVMYTEGKTTFDIYKELLESNIKLYEWAMNLDKYQYEKEEGK